ncbi:hypothetical protein [Bathymodiolus japonicus methanotrophic gill symbiont]|uniref:hypothetical protein n=1 Tax=Bathymodiolus japonicus methanotrophic gill symbiont TaxID=113269 RepID=UPI001C8E884F|nr:hypothetical protein [Bathymodiolus japonicus methanotrophic gill symbiont]
MDEAAKESGGSQVISQLRKNQNIEYRGRIRSVESYFNSINKGIDQIIRVRGGKEIKVTVSSARLNSMFKFFHPIAIKLLPSPSRTILGSGLNLCFCMNIPAKFHLIY